MTVSINRLKASDGTGEAPRATVTNNRSISGTTIVVDTISNWPSTFVATTGTLLTNGTLDPVTVQVFEGHTSGSDLVIDTFAPGYADLGNAVGDVVVLKPTTVGQDKLVEALRVSHDDLGNVNAANIAIDTVTEKTPSSGVTVNGLKIDNEYKKGWITGTLPIPNTITNNGSRSYDLVFNSVDLTTYISNGMRLRLISSVAANTKMAGPFNGSSHYFTKTSPTGALSTVTNNFTLRGYHQPTAYGVQYTIAARADSTPNNGIFLQMGSDGRVTFGVRNGGTANTRAVTTYQSLPLNEKTDITASWASGTVVIYFNGISVPVAAAVTGGTAPTTAGTGGDWSIGRHGAFNGEYSTGYTSNFAVFDAVLSAATVNQLATYKLIGNETNCIGSWSLDNTGVNQTVPGTNDLTATGGVGYAAISPFGTQADGTSLGTTNYVVVMRTAFSTNTTLTVQVPEGNTIPTSGGISAVSYSSVKAPYGFPLWEKRWLIQYINNLQASHTTPTTNVWYSLTAPAVQGSTFLTIPIGQWKYGYDLTAQFNGAASNVNVSATLSTANNTQSDPTMTSYIESGSSVNIIAGPFYKLGYLNLTVAAPYYLNTRTGLSAAVTGIFNRGDIRPTIIFAVNDLL